jgi:hypothetical protein
VIVAVYIIFDDPQEKSATGCQQNSGGSYTAAGVFQKYES